MDSGLCFLSARELARRIRARDVSVREVVQAHIDQVERVNPHVNAVVTFLPEQAMAAAARADEVLARGERVGVLHGLPVVHKDLFETKGVRTTRGSPIFAEEIPGRDAAIVERLHQAGAIMLGKSNTPEFGAGSQTFNPVFGATRNPYDLSKTCGGSSGGAAVALACGMVPIADGSDTGGSLRNPASFNNVVGLRPTPGRVSDWPAATTWSPLSVKGPMARSVSDVAFMLGAIAGPDPRSPITIQEDGLRFARSLDRDLRGLRVAWSPDLGGLPLDPAVRAVLDAGRQVFVDLGCDVVDTAPSFEGAEETFTVARAISFDAGLGPLYDRRRDEMKETVRWNIEEGRRLTGPQVAEAERARAKLYHSTREFFERFDVFACAVAQVPPFSIEEEYPREVGGVAMTSYIDWMRSAWYITATAHPAISVPAGFTGAGLPVGLQLVGRYGGEFGLLQAAHAFEGATRFGEHHPGVAMAGRSL